MKKASLSKGSSILTYERQFEFKKWAKARGLNRRKGADFYFDYVTAVDATDFNQPDIPGVVANGTMTWEEAFKKLEDYFANKKKKKVL